MADDASSKVPYLQAYGNIKKALDKVVQATVPPKFTQDFLATTLDLPGGGARPVIPYMKRAGLLSSDGTPTELYRQFRNPSLQGAAAAKALRNAYSHLYTANEYVHDATDKDLKGLIVQVTGLEPDSKLVNAMLGSFKGLKSYADFSKNPDVISDSLADSSQDSGSKDQSDNTISSGESAGLGHLRLGYTINLNLPATTDIAVFNAIFKSLKEHLLQ